MLRPEGPKNQSGREANWGSLQSFSSGGEGKTKEKRNQSLFRKFLVDKGSRSDNSTRESSTNFLLLFNGKQYNTDHPDLTQEGRRGVGKKEKRGWGSEKKGGY